MRSYISFELSDPPQPLTEILTKKGWMVTPPDGPDADRPESWPTIVGKVPPMAPVLRQRRALDSQLEAEHALERVDTTNTEASELLSAAHALVEAQAKLLAHERQFFNSDNEAELNPLNMPAAEMMWEIAAAESRLILDQIPDEDKSIAQISFQYPILHRRTLSWGTVHFENNGRQVVIRLRNTQSEKLKRATEKLVEDVLNGQRKTAGRFSIRMHQKNYEVVEFDKIRVLEPRNSSEAYTGIVRDGRSAQVVIRDKSSDLKIASIFLILSLTVAISASPWFGNFDYRIHVQSWTDGWLAWLAGNYTRVGSALFVAIFLPLAQVLLYWRRVRKQPTVDWNAG